MNHEEKSDLGVISDFILGEPYEHKAVRPADVDHTREPFECICGNTVNDGDIYITLEVKFFLRDVDRGDRWVGGGGPATGEEIHIALCSNCINPILEVTKNAIASLTRTATVGSSGDTAADPSSTSSGRPVSDDSDNSAHESTI